MTVSRLRLRLLWLTLFAFGVQIAVADFHHHVTRGSGIESRAITAGMCRPTDDKSCPPIHDHDGCALCWAAAIAATSLTPPQFVVPSPAETAGSKLIAFDPPELRLAYRERARARGPPSASLV
jgi:hypothetical protein